MRRCLPKVSENADIIVSGAMHRKSEEHTLNNSQEIIKQIWNAEQEILDVIHEVCTAHGLRYTLAYGTLIGAVRHQGFIPWDDDIDIIMPREDYERLAEIWNEAAPAGYLYQSIRTDPDYINTFAKIRKDHTTFLQFEFERDVNYHKGVFVDIFPADRVAGGKLGNTLQYMASAVNLLYTRGFRSGTGGIIGLTEKVLLALPGGIRPVLRDAAEKLIRRWNGREDLKWFSPSTIVSAKRYYPSDLFRDMKTISFCGKEYACAADTDTFLRVDYGDYMQLPPEKDRVWQHHPIVIDLHRNYEELIKTRRTCK